jgi:hypothetical protein
MCVAAQGGEIRLKDSAECAGPLVRLGDIADVEGEVAAEGQSLADVVLFPAPGPGKLRHVRLQELRQLLALCDVPVKDWQFSGAETVEISSDGKRTRTVVRPAHHLIPSRSHMRTEPAAPGKQPAAPKSDKQPLLVKRNGSVTVHSLAAGIRITTSGKSLADAAQGQSVLVELADSEEKILAQVVGPQLVEVRTGEVRTP